MPKKLNYFFKKCKKIYTLKNNSSNEKISPAHYKFIKIKNAPKN